MTSFARAAGASGHPRTPYQPRGDITSVVRNLRFEEADELSLSQVSQTCFGVI